jgi:hypothetical protein
MILLVHLLTTSSSQFISIESGKITFANYLFSAKYAPYFSKPFLGNVRKVSPAQLI